MKKSILFFSVLFLAFQTYPQDVDYARSILKKLTSKGFHGRGYVKNGDLKAAAFIANQFKKNGVLPVDSVYFQSYCFPINTFPGKISVSIDDTKLKPGSDFVISSSSPSIEGTFMLTYLPDTITTDTGFIQTVQSMQQGGVFFVTNYYPRKIYGKTLDGIKGIIVLEDKTPGWHVSNGGSVQNTVWLKIKKSELPGEAKTVSIYAREPLYHQL